MFSSLKFSTLRSRARNKQDPRDEICNQENHYDDNEDPDISCASSLRCQQSLNKCGKACGKQPNRAKYSKAQRLCSAEPCSHSDAFPPMPEKYCSNDASMYVTTKTTDVYIERDDEGSLGLTLQGGIHQNPALSRPLVVTYVRPDGPTDKEGTIQAGDRLLTVDGFPLDKVTLNEAYNILRNTECQTSRLTIEYDVTKMQRYSGPLLVEMESPHPHQLGLTLTNTPHNAAVLIDEIKPASIAERCGALFPGDQILSVNDTRIEGSRMSATEVYKLLRICGGTHSNLLIQILPASVFAQSQIVPKSPKPYYYPKSRISYDTMYPNNYYEVPNEYIVPNSLLSNKPTRLVDKSSKSKIITVILHSDDRLGYGLSVYSLSNSHAAIISSIIPGGPADMCEKLQVNDRILSVNGMPVTGVSSEFQPLHKVPGVALGKVELLIEFEFYTTYVAANENLLSLELMKHNKKNLGITVTGSSDSMRISEILEGSVADRSGALSVGDKIISINHQIIANCAVQDALSILHSSTDMVTLQIEKNYKNDVANENVEYTVQLNKQNGPIGITISGSDVIPREIIISAVTQGGLAEKTGALHVGDRVLEIDDHNVSNVFLSEAISLLQNSKDKVLFKVSRSSQLRNYADDTHNRIYGSPGLLSDDSAVESWESSTQRDPSPNDTIFQNGCPIERDKIGLTKCEIEHIIPNVIVPAVTSNAHLRSEEPVYSNISHQQTQNQTLEFSLPYYDKVPLENNHETNSIRNQQNEGQPYYLENFYQNDYNKNGDSFSNVDEIFNIADLDDRDEMNDTIYDTYQVILFKDPLYEDFGFSISDGLYERGVFLNRIRQGGPADKIGLLKPFDRIIQVNNIKTEDFDCCLTVPIIASAGDRITLTVRRKKKFNSPTHSRKSQMRVHPWLTKRRNESVERSQSQPMNTTHTL